MQAVLLAGGTGSRISGADKALLRIGDRTLLNRWLEELDRWDIRTAVVGPAHLRAEVPEAVPLVQETPAFSGPAAGIMAGVRALQRSCRALSDRSWTLMLAVDLASPGPLLEWILEQLKTATHAEAVLPRDGAGRDQYLCAAVPTDWLQQRARQLSPAELANAPVRALVRGLEGAAAVRRPVMPEELSADIDTFEDALRWGIELPGAVER